MQERLVSNIKRVNKMMLKPYSLSSMIENELKVASSPASLMSERTVMISLFSAGSHSHREVELRLDQKIKDLNLEAA